MASSNLPAAAAPFPLQRGSNGQSHPRKIPKKLYVVWNVNVRRAAVRSRVWLSLYLNSCLHYFAQPIRTANTATVSAIPCAKMGVQRLRPDSRKTTPSTKPEYVLSSTPDGPL